jgi:hypothetical protein
MTIPMKIKLAETYAQVRETELARRIGTSPQNLGQRLKVGRFTTQELEDIASALGAEFRFSFRFPDGTEI